MRRLLLAAAGAMALVGGLSAANAASTVTAITSPLTPPDSSIFGAKITGGPTSFSDTYNFTIGGTASALTDAQVSTLLLNGSQNINFSSFTLDGNTTLFTRTSTEPETWAILTPVLLAAGSHTLVVAGNLIGPNGSYSGTINVNQPVPEAKTWAMMLLGFGGMGLAIRRRRKPVLAQIA